MPAEHGQLTFDLNRRGIGRIVLHSPGGGYRMSDITCTPQDSVHFYMSEDGGTTAVTAVNMGGMHPCHDGSLIPTVDPVALAGALRCNIN